jgi:hypothetical protein
MLIIAAMETLKQSIIVLVIMVMDVFQIIKVILVHIQLDVQQIKLVFILIGIIKYSMQVIPLIREKMQLYIQVIINPILVPTQDLLNALVTMEMDVLQTTAVIFLQYLLLYIMRFSLAIVVLLTEVLIILLEKAAMMLVILQRILPQIALQMMLLTLQ